MYRLRLGVAQINTTVGDFAGNTQKILAVVAEAKSLGVDLLYPLSDSYSNGPFSL